MNIFKTCSLLALVCAAAVSAETPTTTAVTPAMSSSSSSAAGEPLITKDQLAALIAEIKEEMKDDPALAQIFETIDLDALLKLTPEEAREQLIAKVFDATAPPAASEEGSGSVGVGSEGSSSTTDDQITNNPSSSVPAPAPSSSAVAIAPAAAATAVVSFATIVIYAM